MPHEASSEERAKALNKAELARLLEAVPAEWRLFMEFLSLSGMRIGEAVAMRWGDVDLANRRRARATRDVDYLWIEGRSGAALRRSVARAARRPHA